MSESLLSDLLDSSSIKKKRLSPIPKEKVKHKRSTKKSTKKYPSDSDIELQESIAKLVKKMEDEEKNKPSFLFIPDSIELTDKEPARTGKTVAEHLLMQFTERYKKGIKQRSAEWYIQKREYIGGSELAQILGLSKYGGLADVYRNHLSTVKRFTGGYACDWGTLFEDVIAMFVEIDLNTKIYGDDIWIPGKYYHANSPDGFAVVLMGPNFIIRPDFCVSDIKKYPKLTEEQFEGILPYLYKSSESETKDSESSSDIITEETLQKNGFTFQPVLLEFKCPIARKPKMEIPEHYRPQVLSGMALSPASAGLFVDALFRMCCIDDFDRTRRYSFNFHRERAPPDKPIALGMIGLIIKNKSYSMRKFNSIVGKHHDDFVDLGSTNPDECKAVLAMMVDNMNLDIKIHRLKPYVFDRPSPVYTKYSAIEALREQTSEDCTLCAVLAWKLFEVHYVPMRKDPEFIESIKDKLLEVHDEIVRLRECEKSIGSEVEKLLVPLEIDEADLKVTPSLPPQTDFIPSAMSSVITDST